MLTTQVPSVIHPIKFAQTEQALQGTFPVEAMLRLQALCDNPLTGLTANFQLSGALDEERRAYLTGSIEATVALTCQRCLKPMMYPLKITFKLSPVFDEEAAQQLPSSYEPLYLSQDEIALNDLLEDELILALPLIPKHDHCLSINEMVINMPEDENFSGIKGHPFDKLRHLKVK
ncbi:MAG: hypothetical protein A2X77_02020 [Gammaproteobacteria bacterium GWE2_42_36]|nr:MAG: hypothetical protein A2X77_02020 [Gammaproteobacteria bacterium GWE2_42_36]